MNLYQKFIVNGAPRGKQRARTFYNARMGKMQSITPEATKDYESLIRWSFKQAGGEYAGDKDIKLRIAAVYPIPKSFSKSKRQEAIEGRIFPKVKPDIDNIAKSVLDALNGVCYADDKQVVDLAVYKVYGTEPRLEVTVEVLEWA